MEKHQPIFFLMNSIDLVRGGLTKASLKQASTFAEMGFEVYMVTFNFNLNYPNIRKSLIEMGKIHPNVTIINQYEELDGNMEANPSRKSLKKKTLKELAGGGTINKRKGKNAYRIYDNGIYKKYIDYDEEDHLNFIDYFNENRYRTKREDYDPKGNLKRVVFMDYNKNKPRQKVYYNQRGEAYLSEWIDPKNDAVLRVNKFNPKKNEVTKIYREDSTRFKVDWITGILSKYKDPVVISDTRSTDEVLAGIPGEYAIKIWRLHSSHVKYPFDENGEITSKVEAGIKNLDNYDGAFVLTEQQRQDLIRRFGREEFFHTIPHYHECKEEGSLKKKFLPKTERDPKLAVVVSRLSTLKRIDHVIKAFKKVINSIPDARLEIWGTGTEEEKLKNLVEDQGLLENAAVKGYTHKPDEVYQRGLFSVLTSKSEGFALSVLESTANQTPVISYDVRYGPSDLIQHDVTGKLVEDRNIDELAEGMIELFNNPERTKEMGRKGAEFISDQFSKERYKDKFLTSIASVEEYKKRSRK
ncbi:glycosyltransferase [Halobacillus sp. A5]|uniref:glycosyltransferase n=1 Tax=Halobacillus sp. A5 TaxID=2880263 RepID=UPI0020A64D6C|nr:glycosyltransferase [Halobacillus sp. A5]MCP3028015.1 glycosyltransferase [Halobacillus sp. A5]